MPTLLTVRRMAAWLTAFAAGAAAQTPVFTGPCTRRTNVVLSEIMYAPVTAAGVAAAEFIELYNSSPVSEDLSGWELRGDVDYIIPAGTRLAGGAFLVIAATPAALTTAGAVGTVLGPWTGDLPNGSGTVRVRKPSGAIVLETHYGDGPPWPRAADGTGHSMVLARPAFGESQPAAWAASARPGGSPGTVDARTLNPAPRNALERVVFSEILASSAVPGGDFLELFNPGPGAADLSGCRLTPDRALPGYTIPDGTVLPAGGYRAFSETTLAFPLDDSGGDLLLRAADGLTVLQALKYDGQDIGLPYGPTPLPDGEWRELGGPTPGAANARRLDRPVVINEIHYHPAGDDDTAEFIELLNTGSTPADLTGWQFNRGVTFSFASGTVLPPGGYLVIARDRTRLLSLQPGLAPALVTGNYTGTLSNSGEPLVLSFSRTGPVPGPTGPVVKTWQVTADAVTWADGGRWPSLADGGGTSLQLIDPRSDNALAPNWKAADESDKAVTVTVEHTGVLDHGHTAVPAPTRFFLMLQGEGEALVDDVEVLVNGSNLLSNGNFASGLTGWKLFGTHRPTTAQGGAMRLSATDGGDPANLVECPLSSTIAPGTTATLRAKVRWISGTPEILLGLNGGWLEAAGTLPVPLNAGTPGAANAGSGNHSPAITAVAHAPLLPQAADPITITARVDDPDGLTAVRVRYRPDPSTTLTSVIMADDGVSQGDALAGDGVYTGRIPPQAAGSLIAFQVSSVDASPAALISNFPANAPVRECHVRVGEVTPAGAFSTCRLWLTQASHNSWRDRERSSNLDLDATFVSDGRVIYNAGVSYAGSQNGVTIYDSPTGAACGYNISLPPDEVFLNVQKMTLDRETTRDPTRQRERLMHWFLDQLGLPNLHRRYVHVYLNGVKRDQLIIEDVQKPNSDTMSEWFDDKGRLTKTNPWFEFDANGTLISGALPNRLQRFTTTGGTLKLPRYRWTWSHAAGHASAHDFSGISALINAFDAADAGLAAALQPKADLRQWMRTFAMNDLASFWDTFGNPGSKNAYLFESLSTGRWSVVTWDMDVGLGVFNDPVDQALFPNTIDPAVSRLYADPGIVRDYWQALDESLAGFFVTGSGTAINQILQETYSALTSNGAAVTSPFVPSGPYNLSVTDWITQRRAFLTTQLSGKTAAFSASGPATSPLALVSLTGTGPLATDTISVNGTPLSLTWSGVNQWTAKTALQSGVNSLLVQARDRNGNPLGSTTLTIQFTGSPSWPALRFNEWMAANPTASGITDPADGKAEDWLEIYNPSPAAVSLEGWYLSDDPMVPLLHRIPTGFSLGAGGIRLVWADGEIFQNDPATRQDIHAGFKLGSSGETLLLSAPDGTIIDRITFGPQTPGISQQRQPDGGALRYTLQPTPGTTNLRAPATAPAQVLWSGLENSFFRIDFTTTATGISELETSPNLSVWSPPLPPLPGNGAVQSFLLPAPLPGPFYFRIRSH